MKKLLNYSVLLWVVLACSKDEANNHGDELRESERVKQLEELKQISVLIKDSNGVTI